MNKKAKYVISIVLSGILLIFFYTLLHECGHALVAIICNGKVEKMVLGLNAHVQTSGANFTPLNEALFNAAGAVVPVIFLTIALIIYNPKLKNVIYHIIYGFLWLMITCSLLAWVIVPLITFFAFKPEGDDTTKFLSITGLHPLIVAFSALLIIAIMIFFAYKKGLFRKIKEFYMESLQKTHDKVSKKLLIILFIGIVLGISIMVVGSNILIPNPIFKTSLSMEVTATTQDMKLPFEAQKSKLYSMNMELRAKGILTDIQIYRERRYGLSEHL